VVGQTPKLGVPGVVAKLEQADLAHDFAIGKNQVLPMNLAPREL
jgi:hypothetical protein